MGAVNYFTSDYITIGYNINNVNYDDEFYTEDIEWSYNEINEILKNEHFYYFNVTLKPGYYEGFTIDIENNFKYCFDDYNEKLQAQKEVTQIKNFLKYVINYFNMNVIFSGWCTSYLGYKESLKKINNGIKMMRNEIKITPTYYTLKEA